MRNYKRKYKEEYENKMGYTKDKRIQTLKNEFLKTFNLSDVTIKDELEPIFELKYSKSKGVYTLYYFENYVAKSVDKLADLIKQRLYDQKIMPLDSSITNIDGIDVVSNITYLLKSKENIEVLNNNVLYIDK